MPNYCTPRSIQRPQPIGIPIGMTLCALLATSIGCRGQAQNELYRQRLTSEIRVLEDQLYDADYENRVLRDKLVRLEKKLQGGREDQIQRKKDAVPHPDPMSDMPSLEEFDMGHGFDPLVDEGEPVGAEELPAPAGAADNPFEDDDSATADDPPAAELLPPPSGPEPPGKEDLEIPPIIPGELLPPPAGTQEDDRPPGQVVLPESIQAKANPIPQSLRLHKGLSGGHRFDDEQKIEGMFLVVNAVDDLGQTVDLARFDIDAELTIVALDPELEPSQARIGQWKFTAEQVREFLRSDPISGLHVPVRWQKSEPVGDEVIVHIRLQAEEEEMKCEGRLKVGAAANLATWMPRGERR